METGTQSIRPNKKYLCLGITRPDLNLLLKPNFFRFSGETYNFMHFERHFAFQNA